MASNRTYVLIKERVATYQWVQQGDNLRKKRCRYCGEVLLPGEAYYELGGQVVCPGCLPLAAAVVLLPFRHVAGEEECR